MTGGGDLDEIGDEDADVMDDDELGGLDQIADTEIDEAGGTGDGEADAPVADALGLNENDPDPTAGASDVGGAPGGVETETGETRGDDAHEVGGGQTGMGKGPTGS